MPLVNVSSDTTSNDELEIDLTAPIAPGVTSQTTSNPLPVMEGTATLAAGDTLTVELNSVVYTAGAPGSDNALIDNGNGTWTLTIPVDAPLPDNLYQVIALVTDEAGNVSSDPGVDELLIDTTAPNAPGVTSLTTNNTTPVIEGLATAATGRDPLCNCQRGELPGRRRSSCG